MNEAKNTPNEHPSAAMDGASPREHSFALQ